ncbi:MAG: [FeFe] hydrogenase H-cluster radical SAM maturase HydE [Desulfovibrio sp.]|jgi:biotin synthase|nr:[FeFe] hydrogenase H-cluster radical SAM maturase HydE [Desulfovibrio sp.]
MNTHDALLRLRRDRDLPDEELAQLISLENKETCQALFDAGDAVRRERYGTDVYLRGLIEFTNHCRNNCLYCGIRRDNAKLERYRLSPEEIVACCETGWGLGFRTFVLQGGEDEHYDDDAICGIVMEIKKRFPDCAVTLSLGEKERESYERFFAAGADRYLLRHETASEEHYRKLHPASMSLAHRKQCLYDLRDIGYQVGSGFMVGSPGQTAMDLVKDLRFLQDLRPAMIGIGPFIRHRDTPFRDFPSGNMLSCLRMIAILRLMFPYALIPATTALGTISPNGRELGLRAGANVVMPNLSPVHVRGLYRLYDDKICTGEEAAECRSCLSRRVSAAGYKIAVSRGDVKNILQTHKKILRKQKDYLEHY